MIIFKVINLEIRKTTDRKKIKVINRKYSIEEFNQITNDFNYDPKKNPILNYNEWINKLKEACEDLCKEVYVKEVKNIKMDKKAVSFKRKIKKNQRKYKI